LSLTGDDNIDAESGVPDEEVFLYDLATETLRCVSCNPTGARSAGEELPNVFNAPAVDPRLDWNNRWVGATLPEASEVSNTAPAPYSPRAVLDNGRVFFNSHDSLVPGDVNGTWDAYEYEPTASGSCAGAGSAVADVPGGCTGLLSAGSSNRESAVLDASASGDDVFLLTASQLGSADSDTGYDVYDAHVCGVGWQCPEPAASPPALCSSAESCHPSGEEQLDASPPASSTYQGAGNIKADPSHKKKHKRHHRRKKHRHSHNSTSNGTREARNVGGQR
jgi:hypothetical protein